MSVTKLKSPLTSSPSQKRQISNFLLGVLLQARSQTDAWGNAEVSPAGKGHRSSSPFVVTAQDNFIGNLKYSSDRTHNVFNQGSHVAYRKKTAIFGLGAWRDSTEDECLVCQKDPLTSALQPAYQLLPQLLQWVPPYRRPVLGDGHIHLPKSAGIL